MRVELKNSYVSLSGFYGCLVIYSDFLHHMRLFFSRMELDKQGLKGVRFFHVWNDGYWR